jgi:hypothetical protein
MYASRKSAQNDRSISEGDLPTRWHTADFGLDCAARYKDARIMAFIPIFVYRDAWSVLTGSHEVHGW